MTKVYGGPPVEIGNFENVSDEMFFYQYLPICLAGKNKLVIPPQLKIFEGFVRCCTFDFVENILRGNEKDAIQHYAYLTAKRLYVSSSSNLNRPGWHSDGFMTDDINYIWSDVIPTEYITGEFDNVPQDHSKSLDFFSDLAMTKEIKTCYCNTIYRLDDTVIHRSAPYIGPPRIRTFLKLSFSKDKYNLKGNSHNYDLDYRWEMKARNFERNHPHK